MRIHQCDAASNPQRIKLWEEMGQSVPGGMRLGWTCEVAYCGNPEHFFLVENKNSKHNDWREYTLRLKAMNVGEYFEIERPKDLKLFRSNIAQQSGMTCYSLRQSQDGKMLRVYKTGSWNEREEALKLSAELRVIYNPSLYENIGKHPAIFFFGFLGGSYGSVMHSSDSAKLVRPCAIKGCPFPRNGGENCHRHEHFFEIACLMKRGSIDRNDLWADKHSSFPLLSSMWGWEINRSAENTIFKQGEFLNRGVKLSNDWWDANVVKARWKAIDEATITPQWSGPHGHKGWGKKKIRKAQRKRPAGWHGPHPKQKPLKVERDTLNDIPQWAPPRFDEQEESIDQHIYMSDDEERDLLAGFIQNDFDEAFGS